MGKVQQTRPHRHVRKAIIIVLVEHIVTSQKRGDMNVKAMFLWAVFVEACMFSAKTVIATQMKHTATIKTTA